MQYEITKQSEGVYEIITSQKNIVISTDIITNPAVQSEMDFGLLIEELVLNNPELELLPDKD